MPLPSQTHTASPTRRNDVPCHCPCCGNSFEKFLPFGVIQRPSALCPHCGSLERHRLLWLFLRSKTRLFVDPQKVLHVAPEPFLQNALRAMPHLDYTSIDLTSPAAMMRMNITDLTFPDDSFDCILCYHVLEHIPDDRAAMRELRRVLKSDGWAILQSPVHLNRATTYEDSRIVEPADRERAFGHRDHVRIYGIDYSQRLEEAAFRVRLDPFVHTLDPASIERYGLSAWEMIFFCTKNPHVR